jgi:hypothetical protein
MQLTRYAVCRRAGGHKNKMLAQYGRRRRFKMATISNRQRLQMQLVRYADTTGLHPVEAAAELLAHYVGSYQSRETAIDHANNCLLKHGLSLVEEERNTP